jgi:hemolysin activation/secretion protein
MDLTRLYFQKGYITTRVYIEPGQNLSTGVLVLVVIEGKLEDIDLKDNQNGSSIYLKNVFPGLIGRPLNLRDIEQGLDQINRLPSNNATIRIQSGREPGGSILEVLNVAREPYTYSLSINNAGSDSTGEWLTSYGVVIDNPLGINDSFGFTYRRSLPYSNSKYSSSFILDYSVPYGYWTFSLGASLSEYATEIPLLSGDDAESSGSTLDLSLTLDRVIYRDQISKLSGYIKLTSKKVLSYFEDSLIYVSSYGVAPLGIGLNYNTLLWNGLFNARLSYVRGLNPSTFSVNGEIEGQDERGIDFDFNKYIVSLGYTKPFDLSGNDIKISTQLNYQDSGGDNLPPSEQTSIGGYYTIRGFHDDSLSGDKGGYLRNEFTFTPSFISESKGWKPRLDLVLAYDLGKIWKHNVTDGGTLSGWGYGARLNSKYYSLEVMNTHPIKYPDSFGKPGDHFYVLLTSTINGISLDNYSNVNKSNHWFIGLSSGRTYIKLNDIYVADATYRKSGNWWYNALDIGKVINRSRIYTSFYKINTPDDISMYLNNICFDTKLISAAISPFIGINMGYVYYKEKGLQEKNPTFVITRDNVDLQDSLKLEGFNIGGKLGIMGNFKKFSFSFSYEILKPFMREVLYWDGVAEQHEIKRIDVWGINIKYHI